MKYFNSLCLARLILLLGFGAATAGARDWIIDPTKGKTSGAGTSRNPLSLIQIAVDRALPGDRIILMPEGAIYRQSIKFNKGQSGLEIIGNGVTLSGAHPLDPEDWEKLGENLHRTRLPKTRLDRYLLIVNGEPQRMGRLCSSPTPFPEASELKEGEFRWDTINSTHGWLTLRGSLKMLEWATRENGLSTSGEVRNIKVFDLSARHFLNDGFNIHGNARGLQFFGINGFENFDEGFSAHDTSVCWISNSIFTGNENAIADINESDTYYENCVFGGSISNDVMFYGGRHSLTSCKIVSSKTSVPILVRSGLSRNASAQGISASLVLRKVSIDASQSQNKRIEVGPQVTLFIDPFTIEQTAGLTINKHLSSYISEALYRTSPIGRSKDGTPIMAWVGGGAVAPRSGSYRIIHLDKHKPSEIAPKISPENDWFGLLSPLATSDFPPTGQANSLESSSSHAIWRWIGLTAPDAVFIPSTPEGLALGEALQNHPPAGVGMIKVFLSQRLPNNKSQSTVLPTHIENVPRAKSEMLNRLRRSPLEVAQQLSQHYGDTYEGSYIDALSLIAKERIGIKAKAEVLAATYLEKAHVPNSGGTIGGALLFAKLNKPWADEHVINIANMAFDAEGNPLESMPLHNEMSDSIFMACPILAAAGKISGEKRYFDQCVKHLKFIQNLCLREDGLYRHSPLTHAAWGRGNGFPALGLVMALDYFPEDHPDRGFILDSLRSHLTALAAHQDSSGMWHQLIDHPDSYAELTATCMIAKAIAHAIREGWIPAEDWDPPLLSAWEGVKTRIASDGLNLINCCTSTGKQKSLEDYYLREAILGRDNRGGAMALILAAEMKEWFDQ